MRGSGPARSFCRAHAARPPNPRGSTRCSPPRRPSPVRARPPGRPRGGRSPRAVHRCASGREPHPPSIARRAATVASYVLGRKSSAVGTVISSGSARRSDSRPLSRPQRARRAISTPASTSAPTTRASASASGRPSERTTSCGAGAQQPDSRHTAARRYDDRLHAERAGDRAPVDGPAPPKATRARSRGRHRARP